MPLKSHRYNSYNVNFYPEDILNIDANRSYKLTPCIITFTNATLTSIDIQNFIEMGLQIVRFKMTHITHKDKIRLMNLISKAEDLYCKKFDMCHWPIAVSIDVPNCMIRTGMLRKGIEECTVYLKEDSIVEITCDLQYYDKCDDKLIYIDDPYMIKSFKVGMELSIRFGEIVMFCTEILNKKSILCKIYRGSYLESMDFVCVRGAKHTKPPLTKRDLQIIQFAKTFNLDILTINSVRCHTTLQKVKKLLGDEPHPLIISTICEQEGLDNLDKIIEECDGIILSRENVANEIINKHQMVAIQNKVAAICKKAGKPFYISGNILDQTLKTGALSLCDVSDITNAVLIGAGFVLKDYNNISNIIKAMSILNDICKTVEPLSFVDDFWRLHLELRGISGLLKSDIFCFLQFPLPVNAADGSVLGCALASRYIGANVIIVLSVTGHTTIQLVRLCPKAIILSVSTNEAVARRLQLYRGIFPIVYIAKQMARWADEMETRVNFAVKYGLKKHFLREGQMYVTLCRSSSVSVYADKVCFHQVKLGFY